MFVTVEIICYELMTDNASPPTRATKNFAGLDLYSAEDAIVPAKSQKLLSTDLCVIIPNGHYGRIAPRSGLAVKRGICVGAGVVDADYRGVLRCLLINNSDNDFYVVKRARIAQLICEKISLPVPIRVSDIQNISTERGVCGFGSTGV